MILTIQQRLMEAGRIRIGHTVATSNGKTRPAKLDKFRLTSKDRQKIDQAAALWGGEVAEWESPSGKQWETVTQTDVLDVVVPPSEMAFSQWYEVWSAGGCQRRCDGVTEQISDGPCLCDPDNRACAIHSRLSVMLRDLQGLGLWRIDTSGYYAAVELAGAVQVIAAAAGRGALLPARLRLEQRSVKRQVDSKTQTLRFAVPVLDIDISPGQLLAGMGQGQVVQIQGAMQTLELEGDAPRLLEPVPDSVQLAPVPSVAEQASTFPERRGRSNAALPVPETGVEPRTVAEVGYGDAPIREEFGIETPTQVPSQEPWDELVELLADVPSGTMPQMEAPMRRLFDLMERVELWKPDSLHAALRSHNGAAHVSDLRKADLVEFVGKAWAGAREAFAKAES